MAVGEFLSVNDAAEAIGCTSGRVRQLLIAGEMRGDKLNERAWIIPKSEVERFQDKPRRPGRPRIGDE